MASFKVMHSSTSTNSDLSRRDPNADQSRIIRGYGGRNDGYSPTTMTVEGILHDTFSSGPPATESSLLDASITLVDAPTPMDQSSVDHGGGGGGTETRGKSVEEVWREIVSGEGRGMKEETQEEKMTLEEFLAKATGEDAAAMVRNGGGESDEMNVKIPSERLSYGFDHSAPPHNPFQMIEKIEGSVVAFGNGMDVYGGGARGKRTRVMVEPLDKAAAQRQRRMIKNRESAARSRERKQAYQVELESLAAKLEQENEYLSKEIEENRKQRYHKLMEFVIPVVEKPHHQSRFLRRIRSLEW